ncbi:MAG TPA: hypothetical protein PKA00_07035 [Saprospiraceae bacterium]|nr:hypothetical protein [Saprospiraceae bacterium]HMQ82643.1 hypothetical protein [Saprospiraceae bacterium]
MENSTLISILRTFHKKEIRDFKKWIQSPIHNQREDVVHLFDYLIASDHLNQDKFLQKERVFSKLFSSEPYDDAKLRQSIHFLLKAIEEFLIFHEMREDEVRSKITLASVYRKRKLDKAFGKTVQLIDTIQENSPYRNEQYLRNEYLLQNEKYTYIADKKRTANEVYLQEVSDALDATYLADKLRQCCLIRAHQRVVTIDYNIGMLEEVLQYIQNNLKLLELPAIAIYYNCYYTFIYPENDSYFQALKVAIIKTGHLFPNDEAKDIFIMAISYCIERINKGHLSYTRELFDFYKKGFEEKILLDNNAITLYTFRNVVTVGLKLEEDKWVSNFIRNYNKYIDEEYRESITNYCMAMVSINQKDYSAAMRLLATTEIKDVLIHLNAKTMLLKMYYELDEIDALESLLESMRTFIQRKQMIESYKANYQNIVKFTKKLIRIKPYDKTQTEGLRKTISEASPLTEKQWFLQQLDKV